MRSRSRLLRALGLTLIDAVRGNYLYHAGALSYHLLLALAPLSVILVSFADLLPFFDIDRLEAIADRLFPRYASDIVHEVLDLRRRRTESSLLAVLISYIFSVGFIRSMGKAFSAVSEGVFGERREAFYWIFMPIFLLAVVLFILLSFALSVYLKIVLPEGYRMVLDLAYTLPAALLLTVLYLSFLKRRVSLPRVAGVSLLTSFSLFVLQLAFSWYTANVFRGNVLYGSLSGIVIFLLWTNLIFLSLLMGARLIYRLGKEG